MGTGCNCQQGGFGANEIGPVKGGGAQTALGVSFLPPPKHGLCVYLSGGVLPLTLLL